MEVAQCSVVLEGNVSTATTTIITTDFFYSETERMEQLFESIVHVCAMGWCSGRAVQCAGSVRTAEQ